MFQPEDNNAGRNLVILWLLLFACFYTCGRAQASEYEFSIPSNWKLLDITRADLEYTKLNPNNRDPYAPRYTGRWKERAALKWDVSLLGFLYWRNNVHTESIDTGQVKTVGWEWEAGVPVGKYFEVFHHHHSRHIMDEPRQVEYYPDKSSQFPVEDSYGVRIRFIPGVR